MITQDNIVETAQDAPQRLRALEDSLTRHLNRIQRNERLANRRIGGLEGRLADVDSKLEHCKKKMHGCRANYSIQVREEDPNANPPCNQDPNPSSQPPPDQLDNQPAVETPSDSPMNPPESPATPKEQRQFCKADRIVVC